MAENQKIQNKYVYAILKRFLTLIFIVLGLKNVIDELLEIVFS